MGADDTAVQNPPAPPAPVAEAPAPPEPAVRQRSALPPALVAGLLVAAVFAASGIIRGTFPFGSLSRSTNDLGTQYIPFFAHLWDVLHGRAQGDLFFNWQSAFGVGFLADYGVDLGSPLSLLVGLFPRDQIDLAVYVITVLKLSLAAAAMAVLLLKMSPGPRWVAAILGASYGVCGWAIDDGAYVPMWLDGLIALPMFFLVAEWSLRRTNRLLSVLVVAVFWVSNFYTAYMATIAAGVYLLARVLTSDLAWMLRLRAVLRHGISFVLGMALSAPVLLPVLAANDDATPSPAGIFTPAPVDMFLSRLLPLSEGVGRTASLYVGTVALLLALTLPFNRNVAIRTKAVWVVTTVSGRAVLPVDADAGDLARLRHPERKPVPRGLRPVRRDRRRRLGCRSRSTCPVRSRCWAVGSARVIAVSVRRQPAADRARHDRADRLRRRHVRCARHHLGGTPLCHRATVEVAGRGGLRAS